MSWGDSAKYLYEYKTRQNKWTTFECILNILRNLINLHFYSLKFLVLLTD